MSMLKRIAVVGSLTALALLPTVPAALPAHAAGMVVNTLADADPPATDGMCSLREAITNANANAATHPDCPAGTGADTITFSLSGVVVLTSYLPSIADPAGLTIDGTGQKVTVSGNNATRPFSIGTGAQTTMRSVSVSEGRTREGGGILNLGTLTLENATLSHNSAVFECTPPPYRCDSGLGGGVFNTGVLLVINSTVSGNFTYNACGFCLSTGGGGGVYSTGTLMAINSTIFGNSSVGFEAYQAQGAGVYSVGAFSSADSLVAGNTTSFGYGDCSGTLTATGPNLIGDPTGCTITGTSPITGDPKLGPLADNGGPTQTHALLPGSPAIDAGNDAVCAAPPVSGKDQRGVKRPQGTHCDLGAFELEALVPVVGGKNLRITTGSIDLSWDGGTAQTGYTLLQYNAVTSSATLINLPASATSHGHGGAVPGALYCYALAATGTGDVVLGLSDLECAMSGIKTGALAPVGLALALNQSATTTLTWTAPAGGADAYLLQRLPLDGSPPTQVTLSGSATSSTQTVPVAGACYQLVAYQGGAWGSSDALCGIPGFSTLGAQPAGKRMQSVPDALAEVQRQVSGVTMPKP